MKWTYIVQKEYRKVAREVPGVKSIGLGSEETLHGTPALHSVTMVLMMIQMMKVKKMIQFLITHVEELGLMIKVMTFTSPYIKKTKIVYPAVYCRVINFPV